MIKFGTESVVGTAAVLLAMLWIGCGWEHVDSIHAPPPLQGPGYAGSFPRFPHNASERTLRDIVVFYTPDDISSNTDWKLIGYPDSGMFLLHNAFPKLKVTMQTVPENRYLGEIPNRNIESDPIAAGIWRDLADKAEFAGWLELGNHGYFHSPDGDHDLDRHEFNGADNAAAFDSAFCFGTFARARNTYSAIGLANDKISVMRFPGFHHTAMALRALAANGFLAYFSDARTGMETYVTLPGNREILSIPTSLMLAEYYDPPDLVAGITDGTIRKAEMKESAAYRNALLRIRRAMDALVHGGGVINLFDHWWEHSLHRLNGVPYRFELLLDAVTDLDRAYRDRVWWGFGSELARWSHFKRHAQVHLESDDGGLGLGFTQPADWRPAWAMEMAYTVTRAGQADFPAIARISYTLDSEGASGIHELGAKEYWTAGNRLNFNFPFAGATKVRIDFAQ